MEADAKVYRGRAEQARLAANASRSDKYRQIFEKLARSHDVLANEAEWLEGQRVSPRAGSSLHGHSND